MVKKYVNPHKRRKKSGGFTDVVGHYRTVTKPVKKVIPTRMDDKLVDVPPDVVEYVTEWKRLQKRVSGLDKRIDFTNKARQAGRFTGYDPAHLSDIRRDKLRQMSNIQIRIEKMGYDFHKLI